MTRSSPAGYWIILERINIRDAGPQPSASAQLLCSHSMVQSCCLQHSCPQPCIPCPWCSLPNLQVPPALLPGLCTEDERFPSCGESWLFGRGFAPSNPSPYQGIAVPALPRHCWLTAAADATSDNNQCDKNTALSLMSLMTSQPI